MKKSQRVVIVGGEFAGLSLEDLLGGGAGLQITGEDGNTTLIFAHPDPGNNRLFFLIEPT